MAFDLDYFLALPRAAGLALSPDGNRLVTSVGTLNPDRTKYVTALWELDPSGVRPPRRLTRSEAGEAAPAFLPDGSLVFTSSRSDPEGKKADRVDEPTRLWLLPAGGGEARPVADPPGGVDGLATARCAPTVVVECGVFAGCQDADADRAREQSRRDAGVRGVLFEEYPIKYWDHELGPREPRLHATAVDPAELASVVAEPTDRSAELVDLTPVPGRALDNAEFALTPDGRTVVTTWLTGALLDRAPDLVAIDVTTKARRVLATAPRTHHAAPAVSPDGRWVVCVRETAGTPDRADDTTLWLVELATGAGRNPTPDLDLGPTAPVWAADSTAVFFVADLGGRVPVFRMQLDTGEVTRLTTDGAYTDLCPAPDGRTVYALRSTWDTPPQAVALDATAVDQPAPQLLPTPGLPLDVPGSLTEVLAIADDGAPVRSWLILPPGVSADSPAPLLVWIHGGPMHSWSAWSWRWNPHLLAARGYAVLLPDPALSTGYGRAFVQRGWGSWGQAPYTDLLAAVDAAEARPDIDASRTAAMGGSFGGYMANWVAGHTDRFRCIVTHASIWALEQFHGTTDNAAYWEYQFGDPYVDDSRYVENSPNRHLGAIRTPMLVIHGENDDRVPVGESLRLYTDLKRHQVDARLLLFPDEHHWVLRPGNSRVWYQTVFAFVDHYVLGKEWARPDLL